MSAASIIPTVLASVAFGFPACHPEDDGGKQRGKPDCSRPTNPLEPRQSLRDVRDKISPEQEFLVDTHGRERDEPPGEPRPESKVSTRDEKQLSDSDPASQQFDDEHPCHQHSPQSEAEPKIDPPIPVESKPEIPEPPPIEEPAGKIHAADHHDQLSRHEDQIPGRNPGLITWTSRPEQCDHGFDRSAGEDADGRRHEDTEDDQQSKPQYQSPREPQSARLFVPDDGFPTFEHYLLMMSS